MGAIYLAMRVRALTGRRLFVGLGATISWHSVALSVLAAWSSSLLTGCGMHTAEVDHRSTRNPAIRVSSAGHRAEGRTAAGGGVLAARAWRRGHHRDPKHHRAGRPDPHRLGGRLALGSAVRGKRPDTRVGGAPGSRPPFRGASSTWLLVFAFRPVCHLSLNFLPPISRSIVNYMQKICNEVSTAVFMCD